MNYAKELPKSKNEVTYDDSSHPAFVSLQTQIGNPPASSVITLTDKTTVIQISAVSGIAASLGVMGKWGAGSVTTSNFDLYVAGGATALFVVPVSIAGVNSVAGANVANGLYNSLSVRAVGSVGSASIITIEF